MMKGVECGDRGKSVSMTAVLPSMIVLVEVLSCKEGHLFKSPGVVHYQKWSIDRYQI